MVGGRYRLVAEIVATDLAALSGSVGAVTTAVAVAWLGNRWGGAR